MDRFVAGWEVKLRNREELQHLRSRRVYGGDAVTLFDGSGTLATGTVDGWDTRWTEVEIGLERVWVVPHTRPWVGKATVAVAMPRGRGRSDAVMEKLTELGVDEIVLVRAERSVAVPGKKKMRDVVDVDDDDEDAEEGRPVSGKWARWRRMAVAACKQSMRARIPEIPRKAITVDELAARLQRDAGHVAAYVASGRGQSLLHQTQYGSRQPRSSNFLLAVGPEGGFTAAEEASLVDSGATPVHLGQARLRVDTAAVVGASILLLAMEPRSQDET
uniref:16S rRNA (uracil(1498)-N(3))-methyltransferase n=1 Tax=Compsopogon caeruleus TaxID=31354 RepID=A0A7S1THK9_9RHOD